MNIDDATLMAYLDGELDAEGIERVDAAMARDPVLAARIARHRRQDARLRTSHAAVVDDAIPDALMQLVLGTATPASSNASATAANAETPSNVVSLRPRQRARAVWTHVGALAAGIVLAVIALPMLRGVEGNGKPDWEQGASGLRASGELARALEQQLTAQPAGRVQVALSFRNQAGQYCRTFRVSEARTAGLACRDAQGWLLPVLASEAETASGELRQAASPLPAVVLDAVDASIAGDALDADGEQAARKAGWR